LLLFDHSVSRDGHEALLRDYVTSGAAPLPGYRIRDSRGWHSVWIDCLPGNGVNYVFFIRELLAKIQL
jgi:hypothetical protein